MVQRKGSKKRQKEKFHKEKKSSTAFRAQRTNMIKQTAFVTVVLVILVVSVKPANLYPTPSVPLENMDPRDACLFQCSNCLGDQVSLLLICANQVCPAVKSFAEVGYECSSFLQHPNLGRRSIFKF